MKNSALLSIDEIGERIVEALREKGWNVWIETDSPRDFKQVFASKDEGLLKAFTCMDVVLMALDCDPNNVDMIFYFYANPLITGKGAKKRIFGKKARENNAEIFRGFCNNLFQLADLEAQFLNWDCESTPYSPRIRFDADKDKFERPAYEVSLYYWKEPLRKSVQGYLASDDRKALIRDLKDTLQKMGFRTQWRDPITKTEKRDLNFYIKQDLLKNFLEGLFEYELPYAEVRVEFDRLGILFGFNSIRTKEGIPIANIEAELEDRFRSIKNEFPEFEYHLEEFLGITNLTIRAIFPIPSKDRLFALMKHIKDKTLGLK